MIEPRNEPLKALPARWRRKKGVGYGAELTGCYLDEVDIDGYEHAIVGEYARVGETGEPRCATWEYTCIDGRHERLALPLMSDGNSVDMLFGGAVFEAAYG